MRCLGIIGLLFAFGCSEVIDFDVDDRQSFIVISGQLNNGTLGNRIEVSKTTIYDIPQRPQSFAKVSVLNRNGESVVFKESKEEAGVYLIEDQAFLGEVGEEYMLEVILITGETYHSEWQKLPSKKAIDHLSAEVGNEFKITETGQSWEFLSANIYKETELLESDEDIYLKWDIQTTWLFREADLPGQFFFWNPDICYMTDRYIDRNINLFSSVGFTKNRLPIELMICDRIDDTFYGKQYFSVIQTTMNADTYRFLSQVDEVANVDGSIFDPTFGPIRSNLQNINDPNEMVAGFFQVNYVDTTHIELNQQIVDVELKQPCKVPLAVQSFPPSFFDRLSNFFLPECLDCLILPNSSLEKPYFWND